jgi:hypothetical protein
MPPWRTLRSGSEPSSAADAVDDNESLSFRRRWLILFIVGTAEFHLLPLAFGVGGMAFTLANLNGELWMPLLFCCFFWLPLAAFGAFVSVMFSREPRRLTVSGRQVRVRRLIGGSQWVDVVSLARIVVDDQDPRNIVFVPTFGPPLLSLVASEWPSEMPESIAEYLGVKVDRSGEVDKAGGGIGEIPR